MKRLIALFAALVAFSVFAPAPAASAAPTIGIEAATPSFVAPAYFDASYCAGRWVYASTWGRGCSDDGVTVIQDISRDGYCVEVKVKNRYGWWVRVPNSTACYGQTKVVSTSGYFDVRMYRGNGNYRTLASR